MLGFFLWAWLTALVLATPAGILGCFIFWRRMAFFADALAHASLLGLALAFIFHFHLLAGILACSLVLCFFLWLMSTRKEITSDVLLNLAAHFFLGLGILCVSLAELRVDLLAYFLGEWLTIGPTDTLVLTILSATTLILLWLWRRPLLAITVQEEIAQAEGIARRRVELGFLCVLAFFISGAVQTIGLLLLNTLMIMPAAIVRPWTSSPYRMMGACVLIAAVILSAGLWISLVYDVPASPAAAVLGGGLFLLSWGARRWLQRLGAFARKQNEVRVD